MVEYHQMLTTSLPPVTLISGVGLLLLAMTARYNHSTNRVRQLLRERNSIAPRENQDLNHEIDLIFERASLLRMSILTVVLSATFSGLQVLAGILECLFMLDLDVACLFQPFISSKKSHFQQKPLDLALNTASFCHWGKSFLTSLIFQQTKAHMVLRPI